MKKIISMFLVIFMLCITTAYADNDFTIKISESSAYQGENVTIALVIQNNPGILSLHFNLDYDTTRLELISAKDMGIVDGAVFSQTYEAYPYIMLWNSASTNNFTNDGTLVELTFNVLSDAPLGKAYVNLSFNPENIYNVDLTDIPINVINGFVNVKSKENPVSSSNHSTAKNNESTLTKVISTENTDNSIAEIILMIGKKDAKVFGETKTNDVAPIIRNERTMLPARFVAESLGATVIWTEAEPNKVIIRKDEVEIIITIDSDIAFVNGKEVKLNSPAFIENDRTYTPIRFISEELGAKVGWNEANQSVTITR